MVFKLNRFNHKNSLVCKIQINRNHQQSKLKMWTDFYKNLVHILCHKGHLENLYIFIGHLWLFWRHITGAFLKGNNHLTSPTNVRDTTTSTTLSLSHAGPRGFLYVSYEEPFLKRSLLILVKISPFLLSKTGEKVYSFLQLAGRLNREIREDTLSASRLSYRVRPYEYFEGFFNFHFYPTFFNQNIWSRYKKFEK